MSSPAFEREPATTFRYIPECVGCGRRINPRKQADPCPQCGGRLREVAL